jgi:prepilin-type N-terminal cleavage/methylation domain-containing protein/prepilin-type processing-associated H-X9-DG protein
MKQKQKRGAFSLIELLVVIAVIAILTSLILPSLTRAKQGGQGVSCLNNGQQMIRALHLYAGDYGDWLPPNPENGHTNAWVRGTMKNAIEATNTIFLTDPRYAKLAPYTANNHKIYHCPADKSFVVINKLQHPRVRTFSMNQAVGTKPVAPRAAVDGPWLDGTRQHKRNKPFRTYGQFADMVAPAPDSIWIFIDEDEHLINDGAFAVTMVDPEAIIDWPGTYHNNSAGFAFADGHSEIHAWKDPRTRMPAELLRTNVDKYIADKVQPGNKDIHWIRNRTSAKFEN